MAVMQRPAWQRRLTTVLLPAMAVGTLGCGRYLAGGGRLARTGGGGGAPVTIGEEFHSGIELAAEGGPIDVVDVEPVGVSGPVIVDVRLVAKTGPFKLGLVRGQLADDQILLPAPSASTPLLVGARGHAPEYSLDVRVIATAPGTARIGGLRVRYRAGFLRERTVDVPVGTCLHASRDWRSDAVGFARSCSGRP